MVAQGGKWKKNSLVFVLYVMERSEYLRRVHILMLSPGMTKRQRHYLVIIVVRSVCGERLLEVFLLDQMVRLVSMTIVSIRSVIAFESMFVYIASMPFKSIPAIENRILARC